MEMNNEFIVFRHKEAGEFVTDFKNKPGILTFKASFDPDIQRALYIPEKYYREDEENYSALCVALESEPIRVKAHYTLETLDGQPAKEIEEKEDSHASELAELLLKKMFGVD